MQEFVLHCFKDFFILTMILNKYMEQRKTKQILKFHKILIKRFINEVKIPYYMKITTLIPGVFSICTHDSSS